MTLRFPYLKYTRYAPCLAFGLLLSPKVTGLLSALIMVGILITLHELGHFLVARWMKVPVDVFSIGFGPRLFGFQWKETDVRLSAVPLGGYVRLSGEPEDGNPAGPADAAPAFLTQPYWKRVLFYTGGILANFLTVLVLMGILGTDQARTNLITTSPLPVADVVAGMPAAQAGLKAGDAISTIDDLVFPGATSDQAVAHIQKRPGQPIILKVLRGAEVLTLTMTPRNDGGTGRLGIQFAPALFRTETRALQVGDLGRGIVDGTRASFALGGQILNGFGRLISGRSSLKEVGGPVAIVRTGSQAAQAGWRQFLFFTAFISMNLAVLNALPIPGLDGSHVVLLTIERLRGREIPMLVKERILTVGFFFLMGLLVFVVGLDLWKLKH